MFPILRDAEQQLGIKADGIGGLTMGPIPWRWSFRWPRIKSHQANRSTPSVFAK
jgi:hypothetical protein